MVDLSDIQEFLGNQPGAPGIRQLNRLIQAYIGKVPWESVFRIAKRAATPDPSHCPRLTDEFWQDAILSGGGGTCYESNYAFFWLLQKLGYRGYLTVNDMGEQRGCHAAIVIELNQGKFLVDVGIPLLVALPIHPERATHRSTWLHTYTIQPDGANRYQILRSRHPKPNIYTLLDQPVPDAEFRQVIERDYGESGLFLNRVIIVKVIGERLWRFSSDVHPYLIESFGRDDRQEEKIPARQAPHLLARRFQMNQHKIETAFKVLSLNP